MKTSLPQSRNASALEVILKIEEIANPFLPLNIEIIAKITSAYENKDFDWLIVLLDDLVIFPAFLVMRQEMDDITFFQFFGAALKAECYTADFPTLIRDLLSERPLYTRHHLMEEAEQKYLEKLPPQLTIYRGARQGAVGGFSSTLSMKRAKSFAERHSNCGCDAMIYKGACKKEDVIAYFEREEEIFIDPKYVQNTTPIELLPSTCNEQTIYWKHAVYLKIIAHLTSMHLLHPHPDLLEKVQALDDSFSRGRLNLFSKPFVY